MFQCKVTVTFVRCDGENYATTVVNGVSWFQKTSQTISGVGLVYEDSTIIRIPADVVPDDMPKIGDQVVKGNLELVPQNPSDLSAYSPQKIMSVGDNRRGSLPHVVVVAK